MHFRKYWNKTSFNRLEYFVISVFTFRRWNFKCRDIAKIFCNRLWPLRLGSLHLINWITYLHRVLSCLIACVIITLVRHYFGQQQFCNVTSGEILEKYQEVDVKEPSPSHDRPSNPVTLVDCSFCGLSLLSDRLILIKNSSQLDLGSSLLCPHHVPFIPQKIIVFPHCSRSLLRSRVFGKYRNYCSCQYKVLMTGHKGNGEFSPRTQSPLCVISITTLTYYW